MRYNATYFSDFQGFYSATPILYLPPHSPKTMKYISFFALLLGSMNLASQSLRLELPQLDVADGAVVTLPLTVADFDSIVSIQLSINWDTAVATFEGFELAALPLLAIGDFQAEQGELRLSWFDNVGGGRTLADATVIANLNFRAQGNPGDFTDLLFTGTPLAVQLFRATSEEGVFTPLTLDPAPGRIRIAAPLGFTVEELRPVSCFGAADGRVQISLAVDTLDYELRWEGPDGFVATGFRQDNLSGGVYTLRLLDERGVEVFTTSLEMEEADSPLQLQRPEVTDSDCNSPTGSIGITAAGGAPPYQFTVGDLSNDTGTFTDLAAGVYFITVTDGLGCTLLEVAEIEAQGAPELELPAELQLCGTESLRIGASSPGDYRWSTGAQTDSITISSAGTYSLTITNAAGCSVSDTTVVTAGEPPVATLENDFLEICPGDTLRLQLSGGTGYLWMGNPTTLSATDLADPLAFPDSTTTYSVQVSTACGVDTLAFDLLVYMITATAGADTCIAPGDLVQLEAKGGIFYQWQDSPFPVSDPTLSNPTASPTDSTTYRVWISDINGCETLDSVTVLVANNPVDEIEAYNLLTPNGDQLNDVLEFGPIAKYGSNSLKVYSRWGTLVYQRLNYQSDEDRFDGTYQGEPLPAGNYFYVLTFRQGEIRQTLTIIRE
jgi:gliding motility-associated-like protein